MVTKSFLLVCRSSDGVVYTSNLLYSGAELQDGLIYLSSIDVIVLDVIPIEVDLSNYRYGC